MIIITVLIISLIWSLFYQFDDDDQQHNADRLPYMITADRISPWYDHFSNDANDDDQQHNADCLSGMKMITWSHDHMLTSLIMDHVSVVVIRMTII